MNRLNTIFAIVFTIVISGCSSSGRYSISDDKAPSEPIPVGHIEDAHPKYEPYSKGGNRNYTLKGESYTIIRDPKGFTQDGVASWYGKKFHGHLTSNGEIYDMYSMSAAHKTLPIPSYVKVTNQDNDKVAIVRLNDRGPFHEGRIIDLSYAAAYKLGVISTGTANVKIEHIDIEKKEDSAHFAIQISSSTHEDRTNILSEELSKQFSVESFVEEKSGKYRAMLGPFDDYMKTEEVLEKVKQEGYTGAFIKKLSKK